MNRKYSKLANAVAERLLCNSGDGIRHLVIGTWCAATIMEQIDAAVAELAGEEKRPATKRKTAPGRRPPARVKARVRP